MGRTSSPSGHAANGPWCAGTNRDGRPCGHRVPTYGSLCGAHRRAAEARRRREADERRRAEAVDEVMGHVLGWTP